MKKLTILLIILISLFCFSYSNSEKEFTIIKGIVTEFCGVKAPFENVFVVLIPKNGLKQTTYTNSKGEFYFSELNHNEVYKISIMFITKSGILDDFGYRYTKPDGIVINFHIPDCYLDER